jgi:hypothetical protein
MTHVNNGVEKVGESNERILVASGSTNGENERMTGVVDPRLDALVQSKSSLRFYFLKTIINLRVPSKNLRHTIVVLLDVRIVVDLRRRHRPEIDKPPPEKRRRGTKPKKKRRTNGD